MLDIVSFETAKRLKEAGFPQPEISDCFLYATLRGYSVLCLKAFRKTVIVGGGNGVLKDFLFAPTATDILRELPGADLRWNGSTFFCKYRGETENENPAEALAQMWLKIFVNA
jgi:hypothetical protein